MNEIHITVIIISGVFITQTVVDYLMHKKDKLCYHCGHPYKVEK